MSNYNKRTYNKNTLQEYGIGAFIFKYSFMTNPVGQEFKIILVFEKNLKRKWMVSKKTFLRMSQKLNRKIVEKNTRTEKFL